MAFLRLWLVVLSFLVSLLSHVANIFFELLAVLFYSVPLLFPPGPFLPQSIHLCDSHPPGSSLGAGMLELHVTALLAPSHHLSNSELLLSSSTATLSRRISWNNVPIGLISLMLKIPICLQTWLIGCRIIQHLLELFFPRNFEDIPLMSPKFWTLKGKDTFQLVLLYRWLVFSMWKNTVVMVSHFSLTCSDFLMIYTHFKNINFMENSMHFFNTKLHIL